MPADGNFGKVFRLTMAKVGMPWPEAAGDEFDKVLMIAGELLAALQVGNKMTVAHVLARHLPKTIAGGQAAAGGTAVVVSLAGIAGAAYAGAVIGSLFVAAWDTWGPSSVGKLFAFVRKAERDYGQNFSDILASCVGATPWGNNEVMSLTLQRVRAHHASLPNRPNGGGAGGRGSGGVGGRGGGW